MSNVVKYNRPILSPVRNFWSELDNLFESTFNFGLKPNFLSNLWVSEGDNYVLEFDLPRFKKEDVKVETENGWLYISAKNDKRNYSSNNHSLPVGCVPEKMTAKLVDGVLYVTVPKSEVVKPKQIKVE